MAAGLAGAVPALSDDPSRRARVLPRGHRTPAARLRPGGRGGQRRRRPGRRRARRLLRPARRP
ncbi:hypothetical protein ELQ87_04100 [Streptomyces griseoviridis]|uniref:Uncharacterized protein n=1 Tax=Streptomyces griseoviridis TaxID=45398 RepID=A0A3Q9KSQ1_STRGD|nr:hypothetical protein ELQ87_04100 [Streptomyces griseoviridis]QCN89585.1 hypothetical protein DDJ31_35255 [Streptomyces griseoviridis]